MKSFIAIFVLISYVQLSYQKGPLFHLKPHTGEFAEGVIRIPEYHPLTADDMLASLLGKTMLQQWVEKNPHIDPAKREKLGPYIMHIRPDLNVTVHNLTLSGFSDFEIKAYETRYNGQEHTILKSFGRIDVNVTIPKQHLVFDFSIHSGIDDTVWSGNIETVLTGTTIKLVTELSRFKTSCQVVAHSNHVIIPDFQLSLTWPPNPTIEHDKDVIQTIADRAREDVARYSGKLIMDDIQALSNHLCLVF